MVTGVLDRGAAPKLPVLPRVAREEVAHGAEEAYVRGHSFGRGKAAMALERAALPASVRAYVTRSQSRQAAWRRLQTPVPAHLRVVLLHLRA